MISQVVKAAAVGGITMVWAYFTLKTFKICRQIVFPPPKKIHTERCEYCGENFPYYEGKRKSTGMQYIYVCKRCSEIECMSDVDD